MLSAPRPGAGSTEWQLVRESGQVLRGMVSNLENLPLDLLGYPLLVPTSRPGPAEQHHFIIRVGGGKPVQPLLDLTVRVAQLSG